MKILILGAGGFIGTNLAIALAKQSSLKDEIVAYDLKKEYLYEIKKICREKISYIEGSFEESTNFDRILSGVDIVYHLMSTTIPATSNKNICQDLSSNIITTTKFLDECVKQNIKRIIFISSGGAVYGSESKMPVNEKDITNPISSYGIQKITIEKLLYLYRHLYNIDYRIIRLSNPYGPYQRPNGNLGVITTFIYRSLNNQPIKLYGDGTVIRDFIYIDDAIKAILNIANGQEVDKKNVTHRLFNVGSGVGKSINDVIDCIRKTLDIEITVQYEEGRKSDVPINYLDISLYEKTYGKLNQTPMQTGIIKTKDFLLSTRSVDEKNKLC